LSLRWFRSTFAQENLKKLAYLNVANDFMNTSPSPAVQKAVEIVLNHGSQYERSDVIDYLKETLKLTNDEVVKVLNICDSVRNSKRPYNEKMHIVEFAQNGHCRFPNWIARPLGYLTVENAILALYEDPDAIFMDLARKKGTKWDCYLHRDKGGKLCDTLPKLEDNTFFPHGLSFTYRKIRVSFVDFNSFIKSWYGSGYNALVYSMRDVQVISFISSMLDEEWGPSEVNTILSAFIIHLVHSIHSFEGFTKAMEMGLPFDCRYGKFFYLDKAKSYESTKPS